MQAAPAARPVRAPLHRPVALHQLLAEFVDAAVGHHAAVLEPIQTVHYAAFHCGWIGNPS
ncbi:MAG: hypothetical protein Kow0073_14380 [Immundisolibacter sp.]